MKIVFFGTSDFAVASLRALIASSHDVAALVTQPDRKKGRHLKLAPPPTKVVALTHNIPVHQPDTCTSPAFCAALQALAADLFVVVSFGHILKRDLLDLPVRGAVNLHASLLPKYRGAAPINWAIINGERRSGVTTIMMNEKMDEGDIIASREVAIDAADTHITLSERLAEIGAHLLLETVDVLATGTAAPVKQDARAATHAPKLRKEDGLIRWEDDAVAIARRIRGLLPWPGAYTFVGGRALKILNATVHVADRHAARLRPGTVVDVVKGEGIIVQTGAGAISIRHLQLEAGKPLDADAFLRGHRVAIGTVLGIR